MLGKISLECSKGFFRSLCIEANCNCRETDKSVNCPMRLNLMGLGVDSVCRSVPFPYTTLPWQAIRKGHGLGFRASRNGWLILTARIMDRRREY